MAEAIAFGTIVTNRRQRCLSMPFPGTIRTSDSATIDDNIAMKTDLLQVTAEPLDVIQRVESTLAELEVRTNDSDIATDPPATYLRIEPSHGPLAPAFRDAGVAKIRPRRRSKAQDDPERVQSSSENRASFPLTDHAQNIIDQLREWSLRLDAKQHQLDHREQTLNRRERLLRQMASEL